MGTLLNSDDNDSNARVASGTAPSQLGTCLKRWIATLPMPCAILPTGERVLNGHTFPASQRFAPSAGLQLSLHEWPDLKPLRVPNGDTSRWRCHEFVATRVTDATRAFPDMMLPLLK